MYSDSHSSYFRNQFYISQCQSSLFSNYVSISISNSYFLHYDISIPKRFYPSHNIYIFGIVGIPNLHDLLCDDLSPQDLRDLVSEWVGRFLLILS